MVDDQAPGPDGRGNLPPCQRFSRSKVRGREYVEALLAAQGYGFLGRPLDLPLVLDRDPRDPVVPEGERDVLDMDVQTWAEQLQNHLAEQRKEKVETMLSTQRRRASRGYTDGEKQ